MDFHAQPTVANALNGKVIIGMIPPEPYTPERLEELQQMYADKVLEHKAMEASMTTKQVEVVSNSDASKKYVVTVYSPDKLECSCRGYSFRRTCSHIDKVKETL